LSLRRYRKVPVSQMARSRDLSQLSIGQSESDKQDKISGSGGGGGAGSEPLGDSPIGVADDEATSGGASDEPEDGPEEEEEEGEEEETGDSDADLKPILERSGSTTTGSTIVRQGQAEDQQQGPVDSNGKDSEESAAKVREPIASMFGFLPRPSTAKVCQVFEFN